MFQRVFNQPEFVMTDKGEVADDTYPLTVEEYETVENIADDVEVE